MKIISIILSFIFSISLISLCKMSFDYFFMDYKKTNAVITVLQLFNFAISGGASMFAAQFWGKGDKNSIEELYAFCIKLAIPISLIFFFINFFAPSFVMGLFTSETAIIAYGAEYLRIASFSYIFLSFMLVIETIMKNTMLVKPVTVISSIMVFLNIGLNAVFIYGLFGAPKMEAAGAALATTISYTAAFAAAIAVQLKKGAVRFRVKNLLRTPKQLKSDYVKYTSPILANQLSWGIGFTMISVIMGHLGSDAVAANSIVPVGALAAFVLKLPVLWVFFLLNLDEIIKLPVVYRHYVKYR